MYKVNYHVVIILCFELISHDESFAANLRSLNNKQYQDFSIKNYCSHKNQNNKYLLTISSLEIVIIIMVLINTFFRAYSTSGI